MDDDDGFQWLKTTLAVNKDAFLLAMTHDITLAEAGNIGPRALGGQQYSSTHEGEMCRIETCPTLAPRQGVRTHAGPPRGLPGHLGWTRSNSTH